MNKVTTRVFAMLVTRSFVTYSMRRTARWTLVLSSWSEIRSCATSSSDEKSSR